MVPLTYARNSIRTACFLMLVKIARSYDLNIVAECPFEDFSHSTSCLDVMTSDENWEEESVHYE